MKSYVAGRWHEATTEFTSLVDPSTEEEIARASSAGIDFAEVLRHAREQGGPALRGLSFAARGALLKGMSKALRDARAELLEISRANMGTTESDGAFDIDGATGTLAYYASVARGLGEQPYIAEGEGVQIGASDAFWGGIL